MPRVTLLLFALLIGTLMISQGEGCNRKPLDLTRVVNEYCDQKCHNLQAGEVFEVLQDLSECERCMQQGVIHYLKRQLHED